MSTVDVERLRSIKTFSSLVKYLRDELDWPIESDDFDELTFDYVPEELGLDPKNTVKVKEIKQLRPLAANQPWGIFFVNFEPKRLPVVVLRRILRGLVLRKRQSANKSQQPAWNLHDLLFISSYGESEHRDITFAHFAEESELGDLPTLRVLGWDDENAVLRLEHTDKVLRDKLCWPKDPKNLEAWRSGWSSAFTLRPRELIGTAKALAERMAGLATAIRKRVHKVLSVESEQGALRKLMTAFREALIHDLTKDDFADTYAQTITYGLLTASVSRPAGLVADNIRDMVPITNPFLRDMLSTFLTVGGRKGKIDFDELGINEVIQALRDADMEAVLRDFGDKKPQEDPVIHFYEDFLKEYDAEKRIKRGVFFTPRPVVSFIVRSVDEILRKEFGLEDGLADTTAWGEMLKRHPEIKIPDGAKPEDPFVQILDPACGTGTFLVEVIDVIQRTMKAKWRKERHMGLEIPKLWNEYVAEHLLPRLYGFELMMAPYAIAHMKLGLKLFETGYSFRSHERARIYLTNSLEPPQDFSDRFEFDAPALAHEAQAVNAVKRHKRFTVVIGNPPYSKSSQNQGGWIEELMEQYKRTVRAAETQIQALSDDYSKFLRFGHFTLEQSQVGLLSFITNNGYLDGPLFRDMRNSMLQFFGGIRILNLHGDSRKQFSPPEGRADENVFDIQQGVATSCFWKKQAAPASSNIDYAELWGTRQERYDTLSGSVANHQPFERLHPTAPFFLFIPVSRELEAEFQAGWHLYDVFGTGNSEVDNHASYGAGFVTQQDKFAIGFCKDDIVENVRVFLDPNATDAALWERFDFCSTNQWSFDRAKKELRGSNIRSLTKRCLYRPFDYRFTVFDRNICTIIRKRITSQFDEKNIGLLATRRVTRLPFNNVFATKHYTEYKVASHDRNTIVFPLWIRASDENDSDELFDKKARLNLSPGFLREIARHLSLPQEPKHGLPQGLTAEDLFRYVYGVFHSPSYRSRYGEFLKIDFPRLPLTSSLELFRALAKLGGELVALHLMESPKLERAITKYKGKGDDKVSKGYPKYAAETVKINPSNGFEGVPEHVWNLHIGGYQVCEKWLKDRRGRVLSEEDIAHYQKIVVALKETIRLMAEIDEVIDAHGGWPRAFTTATKDPQA